MKTITFKKNHFAMAPLLCVLLFTGFVGTATAEYNQTRNTIEQNRINRVPIEDRLSDEERAIRIAEREKLAEDARNARIAEREQAAEEERNARIEERKKIAEEERKKIIEGSEQTTRDENAIKIFKYNVGPRISEIERAKLKVLAKEKREGELNKIHNQRREARGDEIHTAFKEAKQSIIEKVQKGEITKQEARNLILESREDILSSMKEKFKQERQLVQQENKNRIKNIIQVKLDTKLAHLNDFSTDDQKTAYQQLIDKVDLKLNSGSLSKKKYILINIIKDILVAKKSTLN